MPRLEAPAIPAHALAQPGIGGAGAGRAARDELPLLPELILSIISHLQMGPAREVAQVMVQLERAHPELYRISRAAGPQGSLTQRLFAQQAAVVQLWQQARQANKLYVMWSVSHLLGANQQRILLQDALRSSSVPGPQKQALLERGKHLPIEQLEQEVLLACMTSGDVYECDGLSHDGSWVGRLDATQRAAVLRAAGKSREGAFILLSCAATAAWSAAQLHQLFLYANSDGNLIERLEVGGDKLGRIVASLGAAEQVLLLEKIFVGGPVYVHLNLGGGLAQMRNLTPTAQTALHTKIWENFLSVNASAHERKDIARITAYHLQNMDDESFAVLSSLVLHRANEAGRDAAHLYRRLIQSWTRLEPDQQRQCAEYVLHQANSFGADDCDAFVRMAAQLGDLALAFPEAAKALQDVLQKRQVVQQAEAASALQGFDEGRFRPSHAPFDRRIIGDEVPTAMLPETYAAVFSRVATVSGDRSAEVIIARAAAHALDAAILALIEEPALFRQDMVLEAVAERLSEVGDGVLRRLALLMMAPWPEAEAPTAGTAHPPHSNMKWTSNVVNRVAVKLLQQGARLPDDVRDQLLRWSLANELKYEHFDFAQIVARWAAPQLPESPRG